MRTIWVWFVVVIVVILGGIFWISSKENTPGNEPKIILAADALDASDWREGSTTSKVNLVEYSDFQCPACGAYFPLVEQLTKEYADRIQFTYKNFPLPQHPNAPAAAYAAEAAGRQGKFFEMYRELFSHQNDWADKSASEADTYFVSYAKDLGLNMDQFNKDRASNDVKAKIDHDKLTGNQSQVSGTPTFFLNGVQIANPQSYDQFKAVIDQALNENK